MEQTQIGELRIAYERAGQGPPLLLLQGFVGDGPATWRRQIDQLRDEFMVIAWDAPVRGDPRTHPNGSAWRTTPTALPGSSPSSGWDASMSQVSPSVERWRWSSTGGIRASR